MLIYQEFLAENTVNELAAFSPNERLRYAVHEIVQRLKTNGEIKFPEMSKVLKKEFKIDITAEILKDILDKWDRNLDPDYSVFQPDDKNWLDVYAFGGYVRKKTRDKQNFGKHRNKTTTVYSPGYGNGSGRSSYFDNRGRWEGGRWVAGGRVDPDTNPYYNGEYYGD